MEEQDCSGARDFPFPGGGDASGSGAGSLLFPRARADPALEVFSLITFLSAGAERSQVVWSSLELFGGGRGGTGGTGGQGTAAAPCRSHLLSRCHAWGSCLASDKPGLVMGLSLPPDGPDGKTSEAGLAVSLGVQEP